jgi:iron(III) transport system ATP-binding protein
MLTLPRSSAQATPAPDQTAPAVRCVGLTKRYHTYDAKTKHYSSFDAASGVNLDLQRGEILALLGPSGVGKTTTLRLIAGFEAPDSGTIEIDGTRVAGGGTLVPPEQRRVGMVFQDYALFPHMSVRANVAFGLENSSDRAYRADEVLSMVGLGELGSRMPHELSGGQQQRVALARALAPRPAVVLLDEPFSNLDAAMREMVRSDVRDILREAHASAVFVTHDQDEAFGLADQVGIMLDATIVQTGRPEDVYLNPATLGVAQFLGEENILDGVAAEGYVDCELGRLPLGTGASLSGQVKIAVRPETLRLYPDSGPSISAEVIGREFRGIYKLVSVRLPSGIQLSAVMGLHIPVSVGDSVEVGVNSSVSGFPA